MAQEFTKVKLSGSTDGKQIKVAATATPGTQVHQAHATALDEIWLWANNTDTVPRELTIEWGGVASPDDHKKVTIPPKAGDFLVVAGLILTNSLNVKAFAAAANVLNVSGHVNRITG